MNYFTSSRERRLWTWALLVVITIFLSLFFGRPLQEELRDQNVRAVLFLVGMALVGTTILLHGVTLRPGRVELTVLVGLLAVYFMLFLRLGLAERTHLIEYSVLAVFIHSALLERAGSGGGSRWKQALWAFIVTVLIGVLDELIQKAIPDRVYDPEDIVFNGMVAAFAIAASGALHWIRGRMRQ